WSTAREKERSRPAGRKVSCNAPWSLASRVSSEGLEDRDVPQRPLLPNSPTGEPQRCCTSESIHHARQVTVCLRDENGDVLQARRVSTQPEKISAFFQQFTRQLRRIQKNAITNCPRIHRHQQGIKTGDHAKR